MNEFDNIMRAERARTGDYGNEEYEEKPLAPCPICESVRYMKLYRYKDGSICGCDDCIEEEEVV